MSYVCPTSAAELARAHLEHRGWTIIAGGTDVEVPVNLGNRQIESVISARACADLRGTRHKAGGTHIGAMTAFGAIESEQGRELRALQQAARTVGSPQLRAMATIGGNLGTASPAGDAHPALLASRATVTTLSDSEGSRDIPIDEFFLGAGRNSLRVDEVITGVGVAVTEPCRRSQRFLKVGKRNAMVISVASVAVDVDWTARRVGIGMGSVGPKPLRALAAESLLGEYLWAAGDLGAERLQRLLHDGLSRIGDLAAEAAMPITDHRGTAGYRRAVVRRATIRCVESILLEHCSEEGVFGD